MKLKILTSHLLACSTKTLQLYRSRSLLNFAISSLVWNWALRAQRAKTNAAYFSIYRKTIIWKKAAAALNSLSHLTANDIIATCFPFRILAGIYPSKKKYSCRPKTRYRKHEPRLRKGLVCENTRSHPRRTLDSRPFENSRRILRSNIHSISRRQLPTRKKAKANPTRTLAFRHLF